MTPPSAQNALERFQSGDLAGGFYELAAVVRAGVPEGSLADLGRALSDDGREEDARAVLTTAVAIDPNDNRARSLLTSLERVEDVTDEWLKEWLRPKADPEWLADRSDEVVS